MLACYVLYLNLDLDPIPRQYHYALLTTHHRVTCMARTHFVIRKGLSLVTHHSSEVANTVAVAWLQLLADLCTQLELCKLACACALQPQLKGEL